MDRVRLALTALAGVTLATALAAQVRAQSPSMRSVSDAGGRFTIDLPVGWQVKTMEGEKPALIAVAPGEVGEVRPNVNVVIDALPSPISSEEFARLSEPMLRTIFHEFTIVQQGPMQIGDHPAYYRYYTWRTNTDVVLYQVQVYLAVGTRGFVITGTTQNDPERIRADIPVISRIIATFRPSPSPE